MKRNGKRKKLTTDQKLTIIGLILTGLSIIISWFK